MKQCPVCKSVFPPDNDYCLLDGNALVMAANAAAPSHSGNAPTQVIPQATTSPGSGSSSALLYLVVGVLATLVLVGGASLLWVVLSRSVKEAVTNSARTPSDERTAVTATAVPTQTQKAVTTPTIAAPPSFAPAVSPAGRWSGNWSSPSGAYLDVVFDLNDSGGGRIDGSIGWTLRSTNRPDKKNKVGLSATEYISGQFDPVTRTLNLRGTRKDDPNNVLVMVDSYRLTLSGDERTMKGRARNGGSWNANVNLSR